MEGFLQPEGNDFGQTLNLREPSLYELGSTSFIVVEDHISSLLAPPL